jgi:hypothetical protein
MSHGPNSVTGFNFGILRITLSPTILVITPIYVEFGLDEREEPFVGFVKVEFANAISEIDIMT